LTHIGTRAFARMHTALFELMKGDGTRVSADAIELAHLAHEYDLSLWRAFGAFLQGWVVAQRGDVTGGLTEMRRGSSLLLEQQVVMFAFEVLPGLAVFAGKPVRDPRRTMSHAGFRGVRIRLNVTKKRGYGAPETTEALARAR
jgi:hypothetical protein